MEYSEFIEWLAFASVEPIGDRRGDIRTAMLMATVVNLWSEKKAKTANYVPDYWADQSAGIEEKFRALAASLGQRIKFDGEETEDASDAKNSRR